MKKDRLLRIVVGVIIVALGLYTKSWWGLVGLFPLLVGLFDYCPTIELLKNRKAKENTEN